MPQQKAQDIVAPSAKTAESMYNNLQMQQGMITQQIDSTALKDSLKADSLRRFQQQQLMQQQQKKTKKPDNED